MKKFLVILTLGLALVVSSCSREGYDPEEVSRLCAKYDSGETMSPDDYAALMDQETWAFEERRAACEDLLSKAGPLVFSQEYIAACNDTSFVAMTAASERVWRILVLSQPHFTDDNLSQFSTLADTRKVIDMLEDDIARRLRRD